jgi:glycosyltransferase involved in cell wall biosynthesis
MLFSVIIPTYNRAALLAQSIQSVLDQNLGDFELIVVDDGSEDATPEVLRSFGDRINFLKQQNRGPGAARNAACARARGEYLAFLDSDDVFFPWSLSSYQRVVLEHGTPAFIAGKPKLFRNITQLLAEKPDDTKVEIFLDYLASGDEWRWWGVSSFVVRRIVFAAAGGFVEANVNGEDGDLALKLGEAGGFAQITRPFTFGYREHQSNVMKDAARNVQGAVHLVKQEEAGSYPGQKHRSRERWRILTRHVKPASIEGLRYGLAADAWWLYRHTLRWNLALGHWKYVSGFPFLMAFGSRRAFSV